MNSILSRSRADLVGIAGSVLCIVHCLATPFLLLTASWLRNDVLRTGFLGLDYVFIGINILAVYSATRRASTPRLRAGLWGFLALFAVCLLLEDVNPLFEYGAYAASAGLIVSHLASIRHCRRHHVH